jgi:hypothetical protein
MAAGRTGIEGVLDVSGASSPDAPYHASSLLHRHLGMLFAKVGVSPVLVFHHLASCCRTVAAMTHAISG